jgi:DNA-binding NarL/FixJ family response regulator
VKTVEKHVASIFEKLGVKSRSQVAAMIAREGRENAER